MNISSNMPASVRVSPCHWLILVSTDKTATMIGSDSCDQIEIEHGRARYADQSVRRIIRTSRLTREVVIRDELRSQGIAVATVRFI